MSHFGPRITQNPLFRKSVHTRLRARSAVVWGAITVIISLFIFMVSYVATINQGTLSKHDAAGSCLLSLLVLQGILLMFMGTGAVAYGVAEEREQGLIDYQRLNPMSGPDKILGYLFGLPVREYFLFGLTLPFTLIAAIGGGVSFLQLGRLYMVFLTLTLVYHLTGFVAGMVASRPRRASWFGRGAILILYLFLPQVAHFGFTIFGYLTVFPTASEVMTDEWGSAPGGMLSQKTWESMPFFGIEVNPTIFTMALQVALIALFVVILLRKWRHDSAQALSKPHAIIVFAGLQVLVIGSLSPLLMDPDRLFLLAALLDEGNAGQGLAAVYYIFWALSVFVAGLLLNTVTPDPNQLVVGWRRARKRGLARPRLWADYGSSLWVALVMATIGAASYALLIALTGRQSLFFGEVHLGRTVAYPAVLFFCVLLVMQGLRQRYGPRGLALAVFAIGILPGMISIVLVLAFSSTTAGLYVGLPSPVIAFGVACMHGFSVGEDIDTSMAPYVIAALVLGVSMATFALRLQWQAVTAAEETTRQSTPA